MAQENKASFKPAVFPADIMYDDNLDSTERWILAILFTYTNAHTNTVFPSYSTLAKRAKCSRRTAIDTVKELIKKEYIKKEERFKKEESGKINQTSNLFTLYYKEQDTDNGKLKKAGELGEEEYGQIPSAEIALGEMIDKTTPSAETALPPVKNLHSPSAETAPKLSNELSILKDINNNNDVDKKRKPENLILIKNNFVIDQGMESLIKTFEGEFGRPLTALELENIIKWKDDNFPDELIIEALKRAVSGGIRNFRYIDSIIMEWEKKGIKTIFEAEAENEYFKASKLKNGQANKSQKEKSSTPSDSGKYDKFYL